MFIFRRLRGNADKAHEYVGTSIGAWPAWDDRIEIPPGTAPDSSTGAPSGGIALKHRTSAWFAGMPSIFLAFPYVSARSICRTPRKFQSHTRWTTKLHSQQPNRSAAHSSVNTGLAYRDESHPSYRHRRVQGVTGSVDLPGRSRAFEWVGSVGRPACRVHSVQCVCQRTEALGHAVSLWHDLLNGRPAHSRGGRGS